MLNSSFAKFRKHKKNAFDHFAFKGERSLNKRLNYKRFKTIGSGGTSVSRAAQKSSFYI